MASAGTMLSDLGDSPGGDSDFVQRILADLNTTGSGSNPVMQQMPPPAGNGRIVNSPNPNTTSQLAMDPATATPLLVAIIFCIMSLPVINVMLGHYMPSLLRASGDLTTIGLLVKSLAAGGLYWIILNVLAPLVNSQMA